MAEILWDKKVGTYDKIDSNYLTPEPHAHNIQIDLDIEVYLITYDWGIMGISHDSANNVIEFTEPYYIGNLEGKITSANFSLDSTSDMRTTGSFSIILDENSKFITNASDSIFWQHVWFRVIKKYNYLNDLDMYPMFNWGDHIGLWNNNGLYRSDPSQSIIGWFAPNSSSATFNADTKEFSISCTDLMAFYTDTRGGHLSNWWESLTSPKYRFYDSIDHSDPKFLEDKMDVATYSNGIFIEGQKNNQLIDLQYNNYFNRLVKIGSDLSAYSPFIKNRINNVNFNPADGVTTTQIINAPENEIGDYLLVVDDTGILSRWFIIDDTRLRNGQYELQLRRDLIADAYSDVIKAPVFIEKATLNSADPMIFNSENMTYNQIKKSETLLKDGTECA